METMPPKLVERMLYALRNHPEMGWLEILPWSVPRLRGRPLGKKVQVFCQPRKRGRSTARLNQAGMHGSVN
jgi:hypothetical protein